MMIVLGTIIGFGIFHIWNKRYGKKKAKVKIEYENAIIYLVSAMLGRLLLYNWRFLVKLFYF